MKIFNSMDKLILLFSFALIVCMQNSNAQTLTKAVKEATKQAGSIVDSVSKTIVDSVSKTIEKSPDIIDGINENSKNLKDKILNNNEDDKKKEKISIMHSHEESSNIQKAIDAFKNGYLLEKPEEEEVEEVEEEKEEEIKSTIYLHSILYQSPTNWTIWLNDDKITAEQNYPSNEMFISSIDRNKIEVLWILTFSKWKILLSNEDVRVKPFVNKNNQVELKFTLSPHQTYILDYDLVVDGKFEGGSSGNDDEEEN